MKTNGTASVTSKTTMYKLSFSIGNVTLSHFQCYMPEVFACWDNTQGVNGEITLPPLCSINNKEGRIIKTADSGSIIIITDISHVET